MDNDLIYKLDQHQAIKYIKIIRLLYLTSSIIVSWVQLSVKVVMLADFEYTIDMFTLSFCSVGCSVVSTRLNYGNTLLAGVSEKN